MKRTTKASSNGKKQYQCYYYESLGGDKGYRGKKVLTEVFDNEADAEKYCRTHVGVQERKDDYIENDMEYEEVKASTDTRDRISELETKIDILEDFIANKKYADEDELIDAQIELEDLKERLNFAWQDDEAEWNYAREQQEFNPDGSLALYGSTGTKKSVKAAKGIVTDAERAVDYANALLKAGLDEHDLLQQFFDYLPSAQVIEILKDLAVQCDCEDEVEEYLGH